MIKKSVKWYKNIDRVIQKYRGNQYKYRSKDRSITTITQKYRSISKDRYKYRSLVVFTTVDKLISRLGSENR